MIQPAKYRQGITINKTAVCLGILLFLLAEGTVWAQRERSRAGFRADFSILLERNIFSRDRRPYVPEPERPTYQPPPPPPIETRLVLKGITRQRGQMLAFIEDLDSGRIERFPLNSTIARGHIESLSLDYLVYARQMQLDVSEPNEAIEATVAGTKPPPILTKVWIGQTLMGEAEPSGSVPSGVDEFDFASAAPPAEASPGGESTTTPEEQSEQSDILKRLMERRRQELQN